MRIIFLLFISYCYIFSSELDSLLENYVEKNDLSNETKVNNSGTSYLTVYTRKDLEQLKIQSLKDIFAVQRFFPYQESRYGYISLVRSEPLSVALVGQIIKVFIDDHEISSFLNGIGLTALGDIELDFVDHIEIYEGAASYEFTTEAALVTIKLYSKTAQRDNGNKINLVTRDNGGHKESIYTANNDSDLEYFLYFSNNNNKRDKIKNGNTKLSRDESVQHLYSTLKYKENDFLFQYLERTKDAFLTNSVDATPTRDDLNNNFLHIAYKRDFLRDKSLNLRISYIRNKINLDFEDDNPIYIKNVTTQIDGGLINPLLVGTPVNVNRTINITGEHYSLTEEIKSIHLKKSFIIENHNILIGSYIKQKRLSYSQNFYDSNYIDTYSLLDGSIIGLSNNGTSSIENDVKFNKQNYYSIYFQDKYNIDKNNTITAGIKIDYEDNNYFNNEILPSMNIAYKFKYKNFLNTLSYSYSKLNKVPYFYNLALKNTKNQVYKLLGNELEYKNKKYTLNYSIFLSKIEKILTPNTNGELTNSQISYDSILNSITLKYNYDKNNFFEIKPWIVTSKFNGRFSEKGLTTKLVNSFKKYSLVNELILKDSSFEYAYNGLQSQYNVVLSYSYSKDLELYIKGNNIFDSLKGESYLNYNNGEKFIINDEQRYIVGLEYTF